MFFVVKDSNIQIVLHSTRVAQNHLLIDNSSMARLTFLWISLYCTTQF